MRFSVEGTLPIVETISSVPLSILATMWFGLIITLHAVVVALPEQISCGPSVSLNSGDSQSGPGVGIRFPNGYRHDPPLRARGQPMILNVPHYYFLPCLALPLFYLLPIDVFKYG